MKRGTIIGAIAGDTIGSIYEFEGLKDLHLPLMADGMAPTDDSIMTLAVADWLLKDAAHQGQTLVESMQRWGRKYPHPMGGYGGSFGRWLRSDNPQPYKSWGNGSAMRVSAVGFAFDTLEETLKVAEISAAVTHNHPEGIKGAQATAAAIFMARNGAGKEEIRRYISETFGYNLARTCDDIRPGYAFNESCQGTVPEALVAFFDSKDYEDAIRLTLSLGGDADTMGAITGGVAIAFYKEMPDTLYDFVWERMDEDMRNVVRAF